MFKKPKFLGFKASKNVQKAKTFGAFTMMQLSIPGYCCLLFIQPSCTSVYDFDYRKIISKDGMSLSLFLLFNIIIQFPLCVDWLNMVYLRYK